MTEKLKTYKDVYELPLKKYGYGIYDQKSNFVCQFLTDIKDLESILLDIINNNQRPLKDHEEYYYIDISSSEFYHKEGYICTKKFNRKLILIRGWGNLTGTGAMNLSDEEAVNIQDTFADFIVNRLNSVKNA